MPSWIFGPFVTEQRIVSAVPSPFGVVTHLELLFEGQYGTGELDGTVDDAANLITRDYTGLVHFK